jgi:hypothetical protein
LTFFEQKHGLVEAFLGPEDLGNLAGPRRRSPRRRRNLAGRGSRSWSRGRKGVFTDGRGGTNLSLRFSGGRRERYPGLGNIGARDKPHQKPDASYCQEGREEPYQVVVGVDRRVFGQQFRGAFAGLGGFLASIEAVVDFLQAAPGSPVIIGHGGGDLTQVNGDLFPPFLAEEVESSAGKATGHGISELGKATGDKFIEFPDSLSRI